MDWRTTTVVAATGAAISTAAAKLHLRVETTDEDSLIDLAAAAAADFVQNHTNRRLLTQQIDMRASRWPYGLQPLKLPHGPLQSIDEIAYRATSAATETVLAASAYDVLPETAFMLPLISPDPEDGWPALDFSRPYPVRIRATVGYRTAAEIPPALQQAMRLLLGHWYENRQEVVTGTIATRVQLAADQLIRDYVLGS